MNSIFISYRREDAEGQAGRLYNDLAREFGSESVFMDVAAIQFGRDFRKAIDQSLSSCGVFLSVIGKTWLTAKDAAGQRRLDDPADFVRMETAAALQRDIPVIPVLVQGASNPKADQLPDDLKELAYRNAIELTHPRWDSDVQLLIKALRPYTSAKPKPTPNPLPKNRWSAVRTIALIALIVAVTIGVAIYFGPARKIAVPDLTGKMVDSAREQLLAEHLAIGTTQEQEDPNATPGSIVAQSVRTGEQVPSGTRIDVTIAAAPRVARKVANSDSGLVSKRPSGKKTALSESKIPLGEAANAAPPSYDPSDVILRGLQLAADKKPLENNPKRFNFSLWVKVPEQTLANISRVHYDLNYATNSLSMEGGPPPNFTTAYDGWGCYTEVVVSVYSNTPGAPPIKKTFDMCSVLEK